MPPPLSQKEKLSLTVSIASFFASALPELEQLYQLMAPVLADSSPQRDIIAEVQSLSQMVPLLAKDDASHALLTTAFELANGIVGTVGRDFQTLSSARETGSHTGVLDQSGLAAEIEHIESLIEPAADQQEAALLAKQNEERLQYMHPAKPSSPDDPDA